MPRLSSTQLPPPSSWEEFEDLAHAIWKAEWGDEHAQKNGRNGQVQHGVDIFGMSKGQQVGIQCKGKDNFSDKELTAKEVREECQKAKKFQPKLKKLIFATTAPRDSKIQELARLITGEHKKRRLFEVQVYSWQDVLSLLQNHQEIAKSYYPDFFGPSESKLLTTLKATQDELQLVRAELPKAIVRELGLSHNAITAPILANLGLSKKDIQKILSRQSPSSKGTKKRPGSQLLSSRDREALSLIASAPPFFVEEYFKKLVPEFNWPSLIAKFIRKGVVSRDDIGIKVANSVKAKLFDSSVVKSEYLNKWINLLESNTIYLDFAYCLSFLYIKKGLLEEAVDLLSESAIILECSSWNSIFLNTLLALPAKKLSEEISIDVRVARLCAIARCLGREGQHDEAISWYSKMKRLSQKHSYKWGIRQSCHASGIEFFNLGDFETAAKCFDESAKLSRKSRDRFLLGRSLYQLAICNLESGDLKSAERHLLESKQIKEKCDDHDGEIGTWFGFARLEMAKGCYPEAIKKFRRAATVARKLGDERNEALALLNTGLALFDSGDPEKSISSFEKAVLLSDSLSENSETLRFALGMKGKACEGIGDYKAAQKVFQRQYDLELSAGCNSNAAMALHDVGVALFHQRKLKTARQKFRDSSVLAIRSSDEETAFLANRDLAITFLEGRDRAKFVECLIAGVSLLKDKKMYLASMRLLNEFAREELEHHNYSSLDSTTKIGDGLVSRIEFNEEVFNFFAYRFESFSKQRKYKEAAKTIRQLKTKSDRSKDKSMIGRTFFLKGVLNQATGETQEAIRSYRNAINNGKSACDTKLAVTSLFNLGGLQQELRKFEYALEAFQEAEKLASLSNDIELRLLAKHNLALGYQLGGDFDKAEKLFRDIRDESRNSKDYHEYVAALHALANLSWHANRPKQALARYAFAQKKGMENKQFEDRIGLAINYSDALIWNKQLEDALNVLLEVEDHAETSPECQQYYVSVASVLEDLGRPKKALKYWSVGLETAQKHGDDFHVSMCSAAIGAYHLCKKQFVDADKALELASNHETDDQLRSNILVDRIHALLELNDERNAQAVLEQIQGIASKIDDKKDLVDALMLCADFDWSQNSRKSTAVLIAHAMLNSIDSDFDKYVEICSLWGSWLWKLQNKERKKAVNRLRNQVHKWLVEQSSTKDASNFDLLLWPYDFAIELMTLEQTGKKTSQKTISDVFEKHFNRVFCE